MSKHTRGPWTGGKECINAPDGRLVAQVNFQKRDSLELISKEEREANSYLLAAAPELLEALKSAMRSMRGEVSAPSNSKSLKLARAAIAKAEGRDHENV